jgi:siroheme synthase-like protein
MHFILKNSPNAELTVLADWISAEVEHLAARFPLQVRFIQKRFEPQDVNGFDIIIAATNLELVNRAVWRAAKAAQILVNVADTPALCDFYLGSIVSKGNLKIAISTNGKSPTFAKRLRQLLEETISEDIDLTLELLNSFRSQLGAGFEEKVRRLNALTASLLESDESKANLN